jgi:hypothetical protein
LKDPGIEGMIIWIFRMWDGEHGLEYLAQNRDRWGLF